MFGDTNRTGKCVDFLANDQCQWILTGQYKVSFKNFSEFARKQEWLYCGTKLKSIESSDIIWEEAEEAFDGILTIRPNGGDMMIILN